MDDDVQVGLMSRRQIARALLEFGVPQSPETLRAIIGKLSVKPLGHGLDPESGRGRVSLYDPLLTWVLATYLHWPRLASQSPETAFETYRAEARERWSGRDELRSERLAYYLFVTDLRFAIDVRVLDRVLQQYPAALGLSLDGMEVMSDVLRNCKRALIATSLQRDIAKEDVPLGSEFGEEGPVQIDFHGEFLDVMQRAGLYDPAVDPTTQLGEFTFDK